MKINEKILEERENNLLSQESIKQDILPAMTFYYLNPILALFYTIKNTKNNDERIDAIAGKEDLVYKDSTLYDKNGNEINLDQIKGIILEDIETLLNNKDNSVSVLKIIQDTLLKLSFQKENKEIISLEDLKAKLYGNEDAPKVGKK